MFLRYQQEMLLPKDGRGVMLFESPPQIRTIYIQSQTKSVARLPFPYILHLIAYTIHRDGYWFGGQPDRAFYVYLRQNQLQSLDAEVYLSPTDTQHWGGLVCLAHEYDELLFNSKLELAKFVVEKWWGSEHQICRSHCSKIILLIFIYFMSQ